MSTPSARTGGSLDAMFKISARGSTVRRSCCRSDHVSGDGVLRHRGAGHARQSGLPASGGLRCHLPVAGVGSIVMGLWANLPLAIGCAIS